MGYSCTAIADMVVNAAIEIAQDGGNKSANGWTKNGKYYFFERGKEYEDGRITGSVWSGANEPDGKTPFVRCGSVHCSKDGKLYSFPSLNRSQRAQAEAIGLAGMVKTFGEWQAAHDCHPSLGISA